MAAVIIKRFSGISPAIDASLLPEDAATVAINTEMKDGKLRGFRDSTLVAIPTKPGTKKSIYRFGQNNPSEQVYWFTWTTDVDVVKAPIDEDTSERTIYTGDGPPKQTDNSLALTGGGTDYPNNAYRLGLPAPNISGASFTVTGTATDPANDPVRASAYVMTYVNSWGEESAPSGPSAVLSWYPGQSISITGLPGAPGGAYNVTKKRLYRSATGNTGTAYQFLVELPIGAGSYSDDAPQETLGELIETWGWEQLPDGASGIVLMANNIGAAFMNNTVYISVPNALYAYPPEYRLSTDSPIVGLGAFGQSLFVGTKSFPYVINGVDPSMLSMTKLDVNQACVSKRSIVPMMGGVVYATPDGLYHVTAGGMTPLTDQIFTRDQWQSYVPSSFHAYELDGRYIAFYNTGSESGALVFDFSAKKVFHLDLYCTAAYNDPQKDALYLAIGSEIRKFNDGIAMPKRWRSKVFESPTEVNLGYAKVVADSYPVTFRLISGANVLHAQTVSGPLPFRLPRNALLRFQLEVEGTRDVTLIAASETAQEIESV